MQPILIGPYDIGVKQDLKPFMIPDQAFPNLVNAFVFRGRVERKNGYSNLGRLRRVLPQGTVTNVSVGNISAAGAGTFSFTLFGPAAQIIPGNVATIVITIGAPISQTLTDSTGTGTLVVGGAGPITAGTINYALGTITLTFSGAAGSSAATLTGSYYPGLPVMGVRTKEVAATINQEMTIWFDTTYAYQYNTGTTLFEELPSTLPTTWSGNDSQQFWTTNYQRDASNNNLFWATNGVKGLQGYTITAATKAVGMVITTTDPAPIIQAGDTVYLNNCDNPSFNGAMGLVTLVAGANITTNIDSSAFAGAAATSGVMVTPNENISGDGIRYWNGTTWKNYNPIINSAQFLEGALLIVPYQGRFIALNTFEGTNPNLSDTVNFQQRARWSERLAGESVLVSNDAIVNGWREDIAARGNFADADTLDAIVGCGFIKDQLIVEFENSTWNLVPTGNDAKPFFWQRINNELGAEATFSPVEFDNGLLTFGNVGVHTCNGFEMARIDQVIPSVVFEVHDSGDGPQRISGIRDFFLESVYWAYPGGNPANTTDGTKKFFPNTMLIYNYRNNTFSFWQDQATALGYYQSVTGPTWDTLPYKTWDEWTVPWDSGYTQAAFPAICYGNQQGFVEVYDDSTYGDPSLMVQAIAAASTTPVQTLITSWQHGLFVGQYVIITGALGIVPAPGKNGLNGFTYQLVSVPSANTFVIDMVFADITGSYTSGGIITVVLNVTIATKQFTPFWQDGKRYMASKLEFLFDRTPDGELTVGFFSDFSNTNDLEISTPGTSRGVPIVTTRPEVGQYPASPLPFYNFQKFGDQIWKRFYVDGYGSTAQILLSMSDSQMRTPAINQSNVVLHAIILYFTPLGGFS